MRYSISQKSVIDGRERIHFRTTWKTKAKAEKHKKTYGKEFGLRIIKVSKGSKYNHKTNKWVRGKR